MIKAAKRFDGDKNFKFSSYAVWWVRQEILIAIAEQSRDLRLSGNRTARYVLIRKTIERFEQQHHRQPTVDEISNILNMSEETINLAICSGNKWTSLDSPTENESSFIDTIADEEPIQTLPCQELHHAINSLPQRENLVIRLYYGFDGDFCYTAEDAGHQIGVSRERVRQLRERALELLRARLQAA